MLKTTPDNHSSPLQISWSGLEVNLLIGFEFFPMGKISKRWLCAAHDIPMCESSPGEWRAPPGEVDGSVGITAWWRPQITGGIPALWLQPHSNLIYLIKTIIVLIRYIRLLWGSLIIMSYYLILNLINKSPLTIKALKYFCVSHGDHGDFEIIIMC